jgi:hypothetical protein
MAMAIRIVLGGTVTSTGARRPQRWQVSGLSAKTWGLGQTHRIGTPRSYPVAQDVIRLRAPLPACVNPH